MNDRRISIRFDLADETDLAAWEYLCSLPRGSRQNACKVALLKYMADDYDKSKLHAIVIEAVTEALAGKLPPKTAQPPDANIPQDVMDFIGAL